MGGFFQTSSACHLGAGGKHANSRDSSTRNFNFVNKGTQGRNKKNYGNLNLKSLGNEWTGVNSFSLRGHTFFTFTLQKLFFWTYMGLFSNLDRIEIIFMPQSIFLANVHISRKKIKAIASLPI